MYEAPVLVKYEPISAKKAAEEFECLQAEGKVVGDLLSTDADSLLGSSSFPVRICSTISSRTMAVVFCKDDSYINSSQFLEEIAHAISIHKSRLVVTDCSDNIVEFVDSSNWLQ